MKYRIELAASARANIRESARWLGERATPAVVDRWLARLYKTINTLETRPSRCPVAAESARFPGEIRELLFGRRKSGKYRILFNIVGDTVMILHVRHTARGELEP